MGLNRYMYNVWQLASAPYSCPTLSSHHRKYHQCYYSFCDCRDYQVNLRKKFGAVCYFLIMAQILYRNEWIIYFFQKRIRLIPGPLLLDPSMDCMNHTLTHWRYIVYVWNSHVYLYINKCGHRLVLQEGQVWLSLSEEWIRFVSNEFALARKLTVVVFNSSFLRVAPDCQIMLDDFYYWILCLYKYFVLMFYLV